MNEKVKKFLESKQKAIYLKNEKDKADFLISLGLFEKEYSPINAYTYEYNIDEWDEKEQKRKYYKKVPVSVTDEEFEQIRSVVGKTSGNRAENKFDIETKANPVATLLTVIAWIVFIGGFIAGLVFGTREVTEGIYYTYTDTEFSFAIALVYWAVSFISGAMMLGFAEVIKLLQDISDKR